ncbi:unnamed protein product [Paramecium primaurelia]|uniref:Fatty acid hydroxylase domain-containing protein n=1 Tax=Paramecium primaurelia TaxID=5886 RepID=A0A8S1N413_PARPR|nr:unnamed protein product [Paramecium primaurelia]
MIKFRQIFLIILAFVIPVVRGQMEDISFGEKHIYINTFQQYIEKIIFGSIGGIVQYLICCSIVEYYNPMPKNKLRLQNIFREIKYGIVQLIFGCFVSMSFYYYLYPYTPYYKYFENHDYTVFHFLYGITFHWIWTTCVGYWTHRMLHLKYFYKYIHSVHHSFKEPTAFCYCAAHPLEGFIEGNLLLHTAELILPIHPMQTMIYGGLMAFNDLFAHDGGKYDHSDHYRHHLYYVVNYGDAKIDRFFGTAYNPKNYPVKEKCTYLPDFKDKDHPVFQRYK